MAFKVYNPKPLCAEATKLLLDNGVEIIGSSGPSKEDLLHDVADVDVIVVWLSPNKIDKDVIDAAKNLKLISRFGIGMEIVDVDYALSKGIIVCNTPTANANSVAEHTVYLMMACARNGHQVDRRIHSGEFQDIKRIPAYELEGATLGIIGPGYIATKVAQKALGLGMRVIAYNPHTGSKVPEIMERVDSLDELLSRSDFVTMHTPQTPETVGMIGMEQLKKMKPTAFLINTSRGAVVKQDELAEALKSGVIMGAGLDVYAEEPLPADSALLDLDNIILTPHYAGFSTKAVPNTGMDVAHSIIDVMNGGRPVYEIKKK